MESFVVGLHEVKYPVLKFPLGRMKPYLACQFFCYQVNKGLVQNVGNISKLQEEHRIQAR